MKDSLVQKIRQVRDALSANPAGPVIGDLPGGPAPSALKAAGGAAKLGAYAEFLEQADGARCGSVDFWSLGELDGNQYRLDGIADPATHLCVGQVLYEPLLIEKSSGNTFVAHHLTEELQPTPLGPFADFLDADVFGPRYPSLVDGGEQDEWFLLLTELRLV